MLVHLIDLKEFWGETFCWMVLVICLLEGISTGVWFCTFSFWMGSVSIVIFVLD